MKAEHEKFYFKDTKRMVSSRARVQIVMRLLITFATGLGFPLPAKWAQSLCSVEDRVHALPESWSAVFLESQGRLRE